MYEERVVCGKLCFRGADGLWQQKEPPQFQCAYCGKEVKDDYSVCCGERGLVEPYEEEP